MTANSRRQTYRPNTISLGKPEKTGQIQLTDRQLQLRDARRLTTIGDFPSLGKEPTTTAPMTSFSETASNVSSAASNPPSEVYGQGLYDDTGASWHESHSEASGSTKASLQAETKKPLKEPTAANKKPAHLAPKHVPRDAAGKHSHQKRLVSPSTHEPDQPSKETQLPSRRQTTSSDPSPPLPQLNASTSSDATSLSSSDQQRAFLRKVMQSYAKGGASTTKRPSLSKRNSTDTRMESVRQGSEGDTSTSSRSGKLAWAKRGAAAGRRTLSSAVKSASSSHSSGSGSSTSHEKAILRKVLARARKNKPSSNPRKKDLLKVSSARLKNLVPSPPSTSSQESGSRFTFRRDKKSRRHDETKESSSLKESPNEPTEASSGDMKSSDFSARKSEISAHESDKNSKRDVQKPHETMPSQNDRESGDPKAAPIAGALSVNSNAEEKSNHAPRETWQLLEPKRKFNRSEHESQISSHSRLLSVVSENEEILSNFEEEKSSLDDTSEQREKVDREKSSMRSHRSEGQGSHSSTNQEASSGSSVFSMQRKVSAPPKEVRQNQGSQAPIDWRGSLKKPLTATSSNTPTRHANNLSGPASLVVDTNQDDSSVPGAPEGYAEFMQAAQREFRGIQGRAKTNKQEEVLNILYGEEPEGYSDFVRALQAEAAGSHSHLWKSFYSIFSGERGIPEPLNPIEKVKFDAKTKDIVAKMSNHLKRTSNAQCVVTTQLSKDDMAINETAKFNQRASESAMSAQPMNKNTGTSETNSFGQHLLQKSKHTISVTENRTLGSYTFVNDSQDSDKENDGTEVCHVFSSDSIDDDLKSNEFEVTLGQYARRGIGASGHGAKHSDTQSVASQKSSMSRDNRIPPSGGSERGESAAIGDPANLWSNLKLRPVTSEKLASDSTPSWAKVKLRVVPKPMDLSERKSDEHSPQPMLHSEGSAGKPAPYRRKEKQQAPQTIDLDEINTIEITAASYGKFDDKVDEAVIIPLRSAPGTSDTDESKMVIGARVLMQIRSQIGESKALVIWRLDRNDVESITLDVSAFHVTLLLKNSDESKHLLFTKSEDCLKFANAFHEMAKSNESEPEQDESIGPNDSMFVEQLSHEEQMVLVLYRHKRKTKDSEDAMKESLKSPASETGSGNRPFSVLDTSGCAPPSPSSTISGSLLSTTESRIAGSYKKMLKENVPKDDVRERMLEHNVDPKIMGFVLGEDMLLAEESSTTSRLSQEEENVAALYRKMLKMMIPSDAVRHKMAKENVDKKIVIAVLGHGQISEEVLDQSASTLTGAEQAIANSYKKMLKMMIPKEAVEHKMIKDNVDPKIIMVVVGASGKPGSRKGHNLTDEEESVASSYRQLLKLQIPRIAVRHRMEKEKIPENIIRSVLGEPPLKDADSNKTPPRRNIKQGFHWNALPSGEKLTKSIWAKSKGVAGSPEQQEISKHIELFQKKQNASPATTQTKKSQSGGNETPMAELMDLNRANNVSISLKAFKDFSNKELSDIIEFIDPLCKIHGDRVTFLRDILPAAPEVKAIMEYRGSDDALVPAERWFRKIVHVKRVEEKVAVLMTMETFKLEADELADSFQQLTNVCHQVMDSEKLPDLLEMVRQIGNRMNEGRGEAAGFKLDFLPRLAQTKGTDRKTTALDLMVMIFLARDQREALMLSSDFPECQNASRIVLSDLVGDVKTLGSSLKKCRQELMSLRKDSGEKRLSPRDSKSEIAIQRSALATSNPTKAKTEFAGPSQALFGGRSDFLAALKARSEQDTLDSSAPAVADLLKSARKLGTEDKGSDLSPRASLKASMEKDGEIDVSANEDESHFSDYNLGSAMKRVQKFLIESDSIFPNLEAKRDEAIQACKRLSDFFCETGGEKAASTLLGILAEFAGNLDRAVKKHDEQQKIADRKQKLALKKRESASAQDVKPTRAKKEPATTERAEKNAKKSLVLMVNEMLKAVGDKAKEQFAKGIDAENPDERLKTIYELEKERVGSAKVDILSTIEQRKQLHGRQDAAQEGLSKLAEAIGTRVSDDDEDDSIEFLESDDNTASRRLKSGLEKNLSESCSSELAVVLKKRGPPSNDPNRFTSQGAKYNPTKKETTSELASILQRRAAISDESISSSTIKPATTEASTDTDGAIKTETSECKEETTVVIPHGRASTGSMLKSAPRPGTHRASVGVIISDPAARTKQRYIDRWASKDDKDEDSAQEEQTSDKSDSDILLAGSNDSEEARATRRRREQYTNRWGRSDNEVKEASSADLDEDSHRQEADERAHNTRRRYMSRWSSQGMSTDLED